MPDPNIFRLNRTPYSWTSCSHFLNGFPYKGLTAASFKETREVEIVQDAEQSGVPVGITSGMYKIDSFQLTMLRDTALGFMQDLAVIGLGSYGDAEFSYLLQLFEPTFGTAVPSQPQMTLISGCRITGVEDKQEKGSGALVTVFDVTALYLVRQGALSLFSKTRQLL